MEEELNVSGEQVENSNADYLAAIKELKSNSVSKAQYEELRAQNKELLNAVINGQPASEEANQVVIPTEAEIQAMRTELFDPEKDHSNLDYVTKALELREALMLNGRPDPFIPVGKQISPTDEDIKIAEKCAQVYKECIEYAQGDSEAFTNELQRRTNDIRLVRKK